MAATHGVPLRASLAPLRSGHLLLPWSYLGCSALCRRCRRGPNPNPNPHQMSADAQQHTAQRQGRFEQEDEERGKAKAQEEEETARQMKRSAARSHCSRSPGSPLARPGPLAQLERRGGPSPRECRGEAAPAVWVLPEAAILLRLTAQVPPRPTRRMCARPSSTPCRVRPSPTPTSTRSADARTLTLT